MAYPYDFQPDDAKTRQWAMILHLSQLLGILIPWGGFVVPLLIWQLKKSELPGLEPHGKVVANWIVSAVIYSAVAGFLLLLLIGWPMLIVLGLLGVIFPIIGGLKASNGEVWPYPLSIRIFK